MESLLGTGDSYLVPKGKPFTDKFKEALSADSPPPLPRLDLQRMEDVCRYFDKREHKDPFLDRPSWYQKKEFLGSKIADENREIIISYDPKMYWNENISNVLTALDYYKRALNYSGPEIRVPERIETVALASCRNSEILLAYTTHIYQTEDYIIDAYLKEELGKENPVKRPSWIRKIWNRIKGKKYKNSNLPQISQLSPKQVQLRVWDKIRKNEIPEITRGEFQRSIQKTLKNKGRSLSESAPMEALTMYERLLFLVSQQNSPIEYRRYRKERGNIFLNLASSNSSYYDEAIREFRDASEETNIANIPPEILPAVLVESFALELGIVNVYFTQKKYQETIIAINNLEKKLRNIDERSSSLGMEIEKNNLLKSYRYLKKTALRKIGRYTEADEIPD